MITHSAAEVPFYFGPARELFGMLHASDGPALKAALLCPPLGQDQIRCHRLYRQLARVLAGEGIPVLRFDYYGTGDSAGGSDEVDLDRCIADTAVAADTLRERSGAATVVAFGARLGGSIAMSSVAARLGGCIAWDPVLEGSAYVAELDGLQAALAHDGQRFSKPRSAADVADQWQGFMVSTRLRRQISQLHLESSTMPTLLLHSRNDPAPKRWLEPTDATTSVRVLQPSTPWEDLHRLELAILSHPLVQAVKGHLQEAA